MIKMKSILQENDLILIEAAIVEQLRRDSSISLHPELVHAPLIYDDNARKVMEALYRSYISVAA
ncbi:MAG: hypothetical protein ACYS8Z_26150, partial [Planctomycetota bacterium]